MEAKYKVGNLIVLNTFGLLLRDEGNAARIGVIITAPRNFMHTNDKLELFYWVYDVMIGDQLITDVPQEFIDRMVEEDNEENPK